MLQNVGSTDRIIRIVAGVALLIAAYFAQGPWRWLALPAVVFLLTGLIRVCPAYMPFGIRTNSGS